MDAVAQRHNPNPNIKRELWKCRLIQLEKEKEDPLEVMQNKSGQAACSAAGQS